MHVFISIGTKVDLFLSCYRQSFPDETITPKMHMLEDHAVSMMTRWQCSLGLHGEQGAESIHNLFNVLERTYANLRKPTAKLKAMLREHCLQICPQATKERPTIKQRKI